MRKFLLIYAVATTLLLAFGATCMYYSSKELSRLENNNEALSSEVRLYKSQLNESSASVVALQLQLGEYRQQHSRDVARIKALGIKLRRVESVAQSATKSRVEIVAPRYDSLIRDDTLSLFRWHDAWVKVDGRIHRDSIECHIESTDTLRQVIHRVPRRFWFIRYGTKAIRQEITSSNPHTHIVYAEYIELPKRHKRR